MALEFLQAEDDVREFVGYLYDQGYTLTYRCGPKRDTQLDRDTAILKLEYDLYTGWSTYLIGTAERPKLLGLDSCGPEAHPSLLGNWGRFAGRISHYDKDDLAEKALMKLLRSYFRRNYSFQRYNGAARMSCHFGPHYQTMEAAYFADPRHTSLCVGYLFLLCHPERASLEMERTAKVLNKLDIQDVRITAVPYWDNPVYTALHVPFLYHAPAFSETEYASVLSELSVADAPVRFHSSNRSFGFQNAHSPDDLLNRVNASYVHIRLQRPW